LRRTLFYAHCAVNVLYADNPAALAEFCHLLFGLEGIGAASLLPLLAREVGVRETVTGAELDWELVFFRAVRR
jgi:hypothetical protein